VHPTLGILRKSQTFFYASAFFQSDGVPPPAPARVTPTVGLLAQVIILEGFLIINSIILGLCCILVFVFFLFKQQFFISLNRLAKFRFRGAKNLQYTNQDIDLEIDQNIKPDLPKRFWLALPSEKFLTVVFMFIILSLVIYIMFDSFSGVLVQLGNIEFSAGYEKSGIATYNLALEFNENLKEALDKCRTYNMQNQYEMAITHCSKAIEINENYITAYTYRGLSYSSLKQYDQAIADFSKVIEIIPIATGAYINRGTVYLDQQKFDLAVSEFTKSIVINPKEPQAWLNRGLAYFQQNKNDLAISDCNKAIELEERYWNAYFCLGLAFSNQEKYELAITNFNKAVELVPKTKASILYCMQGITYTKMGNFESAITSLEQGVKLSSTGENDWCKSALENARQGIPTQ
jgi:tetratricopeptide (TPR) repeat protein